MRFYLGTHHPRWLSLTDVPLFVSRRRLTGLRRLPRARGPWALDSGGFSELTIHGRWTITPMQYVDEVRRYQAGIGNLEWAATMDFMVEPEIRRRTGLSVEEHQHRTVDNYLELRSLAPELPWVPIVQGWVWADYEDHVADYERAGVDLRALPLVGIGSICRRQGTIRAAVLLQWLASAGLRLHGFGLKTQGLVMASGALVSGDSMAWSLNARKNPPLPECAHRRCSNCLAYALEWRGNLLDRLGQLAA